MSNHLFLCLLQHIEYSRGLDSGYVCFIDSETAMKARAAVEFVGGLVVKNNFSVAFETVNGKVAIPLSLSCQKMELAIETL